MILTQIQLSEAQAEALRTMAAAENVSTAELIRRSVDRLVQEKQANSGCSGRTSQLDAV